MAEEKTPEKKETIAAREETVLCFWRENGIFEKSLLASKDKEPYVFYDGPPFATGLPHHGHLLQGTIKDVIPRYQTMRGRYVRRVWGWDCHGLPIENIIEKELGLKVKQDIESYGIDKFNQKAREQVLLYEKEWKAIVPRMGRWIEMEKPYMTMDPSYTESVWWAFKRLYEKKVGGAPLIYEGYKSMHICPRCETTLAASEVAQGYKDVKDISVYVKFELKDEPGTFLLAWTTTPWTLPGNVALAVGVDIEYVKVRATPSVVVGDKKTDGSYHEPGRWEYFFIFAKGRYPAIEALALKGGTDFEIVENIKGKDLLGKRYIPVFDYYAKDEKLENHENGWKVYAADFVTAEDGTGIAHEAPAFGEVDMELGKKMKLPFIQHVGMDGKMRSEVTDFAGMYVKPKSDDDKERLGTDIAVLKYLQEKGNFFAKENVTHSYPHCWRCDWPLLNYAASSWFVNVTALKPRLLEENKEISWIPDNIREGRFGKWLEGARDWAISRSRYWGAPIPVWKCNTCANVEVLGSLADLKAKTASGNSYVVMRHGEAETNVRGIVNWKPSDEFHLTEKGRSQSKSAALKLKGGGIDIIIASPLMRTSETASVVAEALGLKNEDIIIDPRIAEVNTGDFNGCAIAAYRDYFTSTLEKFSKPSPNGETLHEMKNRLGEFLYETDKKYSGKKILIVTHEYAAWLLDAVAHGADDAGAAAMRDDASDDYIANAEVREFAFAPVPHNASYELDFHRPYIDNVHYRCTCGLGEMARVPEVFDCWYESGSMPFAQFHYMGDETTDDAKLFFKNFPADFIAEALDQTRGWFYTMLILSTGLFDRAAYKSVITTGLILAEDGQKMSKKLKNYPDPMEVAGKYGADALRFYMIGAPVVRGEELRFAESGVDEIFKKIITRFDNVRAFYDMYAAGVAVVREVPKPTHPLDRWIIARFYETHAEVTHHLDTHELDRATRPITTFIDDLSTWYLRRSRERFKSEDAVDRTSAIQTTGWVLLETAKLLAPFTPFIAEDCYQRLTVEKKKESIHLESWSGAGIAPQKVIEEMAEARRITTVALEARAKAGIKVRQPLAKLTAPKLSPEIFSIIADEVNVKEVIEGNEIILDTTITPELKSEGELREQIRETQDKRKEWKFMPKDRINVVVTGAASTIAAIQLHMEEYKRAVNAESVISKEGVPNIEVQKVVEL